MNANELADVMEKYSVAGFMTPLADEFKQAATMLRQQQAEIEALKAKIDGLDMVIWKLQTTLTNRDLRTYDGKAQEK